MGKNAKNWTVVTSDRMIITNARASHAKLLTSDEFSKKLVREVDSKGCTQMKDTEMSEVELAEWLKLFG
jgi:hypothetical protein